MVQMKKHTFLFNSLYLSWLLILLIFTAGCFRADKTFSIRFSGEKQEVMWAVRDINPDLPADWSGYKYMLVEMRVSPACFFWFGLKTEDGILKNRIMPLPDVWVRMSIPLDYYRTVSMDGIEMAELWGKPRIMGRISTYASRTGTMRHVDSIWVSFYGKPFGNETFEIRSLTLSNEDTGAAVIPHQVLLDEYGQWALEEWEGKAHSDEELKQLWQENDRETLKYKVERDRYGGFPHTGRKATGFFRLEQIDGRWWLRDPLGNLFLGTGVNGVRYVKYEYTPTHGREYIFEKIPPEPFRRPSTFGFPEPEVSFSQWNLYRRYGENWKQEWGKFTVQRLRQWGLNIVNWSDTSLNDQIVYAKFLTGWGIEDGVFGIPDIYSEQLKKKIDSLAQAECSRLKNDPWMLGYFTGNEPVWPGQESLAVDAILQGPATETQKRLRAFLAEGDTPERRKEFIISAYTDYLVTVKEAIRRYDPNHMILGTRLGGDPSEEAIRLAAIFDVVTLNVYMPKIRQTMLDSVYDLAGKPVFIGEFHMGVADRGMAAGLVRTTDRRQRALGYREYVENAFAHPAVVAVTWYKWRDDPATGHEYGENYNLGIVDITDQAYPLMIRSVVQTHGRLLEVHAGKEPPFDYTP